MTQIVKTRAVKVLFFLTHALRHL